MLNSFVQSRLKKTPISSRGVAAAKIKMQIILTTFLWLKKSVAVIPLPNLTVP